MVLVVEVRWTDPSGIVETLPDVVSINISKGDGLEKNSCTVNLKNDYTMYRPYIIGNQVAFRPEQQIDIYCRYDDDGSGLDDYNTDYLLFSGRVVEYEVKTTDKETPLKLKLADSSYIALNRVWLGVETGTPPQLIKQIVDFTNQNVADPRKHIIALLEKDVTAISTLGVVTCASHGLQNGDPVVLYDTNSTPSADGRWVASSVTTNTFQLKSRFDGTTTTFSVAGTSGKLGGIQATKSDDSAYSSVEITSTGKPAYENIKQLSQETYTGEVTKVPNRFHVDGWNSLRWFFPDRLAKHVLVEGRTTAQSAQYFHPVLRDTYSVTDTRAHDITSVNLTYAVYDVVSFIIYKAGQDLVNNQIQNFAYKDGSGTPTSKDSLRVWEDISRELKRREAAIGNLTFAGNDTYTVSVTSGTTSWGVAYTTSDEYNDAFRLEAERLALARAQAEFDKTGNPRWKGTIEMRGQAGFEVNDTAVVSAPRHGVYNVYVRIVSVKNVINRSGWFTTLEVSEEVPKDTI